MTQQLTPSQQHWYDLAAMHADDFATRAEQHDRENTFPFENFEAMKASGYTNMPIPEELGGGGASMLDVCIAQERLARGCGATALAVNMHFGLPLIWADLLRTGDDSVRPLLEEVARNRWIVFGAVSEPGVDTLAATVTFGYSTVKAQRVDGGYLINGRKGFGTNSPIGDLFLSTAMYDDPAEGPVGLMYSIPVDTRGMTCLNDWDTLGMRATCSHSWVLEDLFVPEENVVIRHNPAKWDRHVRALLASIGGNFSAVYLGVARAARDFAVEYSKPRVRVPREHPVSYYPSSQFLAAEMDIGLKAAWAYQLKLATDLCDPWTWAGGDDQIIVDAIAMQYFCMHTAVDVVNKALELVGGAALAKRLPLERYYRDVRSGPIHFPGGYPGLEIVGKHAFGMSWDHKPRWA